MKTSPETYFQLRRMLKGILPWLLLVLAVPAWAGDPFGFTGIWTYRETGGDIESASQFSHSYNLNYNKELSQYMTLSGSLRYNENLPSEGTSTVSISPSVTLDTRNDLFFFSLGASQNRFNRDGSPTLIDNTWGANFLTVDDDWPGIQLFFNQGHNYDDGRPRLNDIETIDYGGSIQEQWLDFDLLYDFRGSMSDDQLLGSSTETIDHLGQIKYLRSFFDDRLTLSASQLYRQNEITTEIPTSVGGEFLLPVTILSASSGADDTPANTSLTDNPNLIDRDEVNSAGVDITTSTVRQNLAAEVNFQPVDRLRVLLDQELSAALQALLSWQVWVSDDAISWTLVANIPAVYQLENTRTVVVIDLLSSTNNRYVKAVSDVSIVSLSSVFVTELEVGEIQSSTAERVSIRTEVVSQQSEVGFSYRPNDQWRVNYFIRRTQIDQDRAADTEQLNQSLTFGYMPLDWLDFSFGVSENTSKVDGSPDQKTRVYAASMSAQLLRTLDFSLGYTHSQNDNGEGQETKSDSINAILNAIIYPDLSANLTSSWSRAESQSGGETTSVGMTLSTNARLTPKLDLNVNGSYNESRTEGPVAAGDISDSETRYGLNANYRPSDVLQFSGSFNRNEDLDQNSLGGSASYLVSRRLQTLASFAYDFGDQQTELYNATVSWLVTESLSWEATGSFLSSDGGDSWAMSSSVNANF